MRYRLASVQYFKLFFLKYAAVLTIHIFVQT